MKMMLVEEEEVLLSQRWILEVELLLLSLVPVE